MKIRTILKTTVLILVLITTLQATATALSCDGGDICVNTTGWWRDGGAFYASETPIQAAVDDAIAGDVICVAAGGYNENVDIATSHLILRGAGAGVVTVTATSSSDHVFEVTAYYVNISGFTVTGAWDDVGIHLKGADHCNISKNNASNNHVGIYLSSSSNNTLTCNTANSNRNDGIYLSSSSNNTLLNNIANSNHIHSDGIELYNSNNNTLLDNTASHNYEDGIRLRSSSNNMLTNNTAVNNYCGGIRLYSSSNNTIANNIASRNQYYGGIELLYSSNNTVANNTVSHNSEHTDGYGIRMYSSSGNLIYNNYFNNTNNYGFLNINNACDNANNRWNITKTNGTSIIGGPFLGGNYWSDYAGVDKDGDGLGDTLLPYNSSGGIQNDGDFHPLNPTQAPYEPPATFIPPDPINLVNTTGNYWVNYTWSAGTGNATDRYNVSPDGVRTNGIANTFVNTTVGTGGWAHITVFAYNVSGNGTQSTGSVSDSVQTPATPTIDCDCGDICVNTTGWWRDGGAFYASETPIQAAVDDAIAGDAICVAAGGYNENVDIATAHLTLRGAGAGVVTVTATSRLDHVFGVTADYVNLSGFTVTGARDYAGIYLKGADHCKITGNDASNNHIGIYLSSSSNNTLTCNTANSNRNDGIHLSSSSSNTLLNNIAKSNYIHSDGIELYNSNNNTLLDNTASHNYEDGIRLRSSSNNVLTNNTVLYNYYDGIYLSSSSNNTIANNNASWNRCYCGIELFYGSSNNTVANNTVSYNGRSCVDGCGIRMYSSSGNLIYNNYFNNTNNYDFLNTNNACDSANNRWNITKTNGTSIIGGPFLGGNYWGDYAGVDKDGDGLGDTLLPHDSSGCIQNGGDLHPLTTTQAPPASPATFIPPDPINLVNTTGNYWVNYTWSAGTGNATDRYNVSPDGVRTNGIANTFVNTTVGPGGWAHITVFAYNVSGTGTQSAGCVSDSVQAPATPTIDCDCGDICVNTTGWWRDGGVFYASETPIQAAVDDAIAGDVICVAAGGYNENVDIATSHLILRGAGAGLVNVTATSISDHVFEVTAYYVNISGFTLAGATGAPGAGIHLKSADHCNISDNVASNNYIGIYLQSSSSNALLNNNASCNRFYGGIELVHSSNNKVANNTVSNNGKSCVDGCGIRLHSSSGNLIYNNYFNNTNNAYDDGNNTWNIIKTPGKNIIGSPHLGGNYWGDYVGVDSDGDGLGDSQYPITGSDNVDHRPLCPVKGDLDGDGDITSTDAAIALRIAVRGEYSPAADVNDDNRVTSLDALMILQAAKGAISL